MSNTISAADEASKLRVRASTVDYPEKSYLLWLADEWDKLARQVEAKPLRPPPWRAPNARQPGRTGPSRH